MSTYIAYGRVLPEQLNFNWPSMAKVFQFVDDKTATCSFSIEHSQVIVQIKSDAQFDDLPTLRNSIQSFVDQLVCVAGFFQQNTPSFEIDVFMDVENNVKLPLDHATLTFQGGSRFGTLTTFPLPGEQIEVPQTTLDDRFFTRAVYELRQSAKQRDFTAQHCRLAIECIRNAFDQENEAHGWELLRDNLKVTHEVIQSFADAANDQKHGRTKFQSWAQRQEAMQIGWEIVWRYFKFVVGGRQPLDDAPTFCLQ